MPKSPRRWPTSWLASIIPAQDPLSSLTLPEILAVIELAAHDLTEMVDKYLPGGHLMTVNDWMNAKKASDYYQTASNIYWAVSAIFSPVNTAVRYLASGGVVPMGDVATESDLVVLRRLLAAHRHLFDRRQ